jgi:hypothetical protein
MYLRMMLTHLGFGVPFINRAKSYISYVCFSFLINGAASNFFRTGRGLRQGCPLSPLLFLIVVEGLSKAFRDAKRSGNFKGVLIGENFYLSNLI